MVKFEQSKWDEQQYLKKALSAFRALTIGVGASGFVALLADKNQTFATIVFLMFLAVGLARGWLALLLGLVGVPLLAASALVAGAPGTAGALAGSFLVLVVFLGVATYKHRPRPTE